MNALGMKLDPFVGMRAAFLPLRRSLAAALVLKVALLGALWAAFVRPAHVQVTTTDVLNHFSPTEAKPGDPR